MIKVMREWDERVVGGLVDLAVKFCAESDYNWPVNIENARNTYRQFFDSPDTDIIYWDDGIVKGAATVCKTNEFHDNYIGYIHKFYVAPEYRKSRVAIALMGKCSLWFDENKCSLSFVTITANIGRDKAFKKLLEKYGYTFQGECMGRLLNG